MEAVLSLLLSYAVVHLETKRRCDKPCHRGTGQLQALIPNKATQATLFNQGHKKKKKEQEYCTVRIAPVRHVINIKGLADIV
jgi:hypothetical protein